MRWRQRLSTVPVLFKHRSPDLCRTFCCWLRTNAASKGAWATKSKLLCVVEPSFASMARAVSCRGLGAQRWYHSPSERRTEGPNCLDWRVNSRHSGTAAANFSACYATALSCNPWARSSSSVLISPLLTAGEYRNPCPRTQPIDISV